jgi:hypothetical protein
MPSSTKGVLDVRLRILTILAIGGLLASSASLAQASSARPSLAGHGRVVKAAAPALTVLYDQNDSDSGNGFTSQNFEASFDAFDNQGADDFVVPSGVKWKVKQVNVTGVYSNCTPPACGPAVSENVSFYRNAGGLPGALITTQTVVGTDTAGSFAIKLSPAVKLPRGHFWVAVQINMDFGTSGQWYWEARTVQNNSPAAWENPGGGFGTTCSSWGAREACLGTTGTPDNMFTLYGVAL